MRQALKEAGVSWRLGHNLFQTAIVWLPTVNKQPVPGSPLIAETPPLTGMAESSDVSTPHPDPLPSRGEGKIKDKPVSRRSNRSPKLSPWKINVIRLAWPTSVELLCAGVGKDILAPGVLLGHDIRFWTTAWRWAGSLVARHQYLPGVEETAGTYRACLAAPDNRVRQPPGGAPGGGDAGGLPVPDQRGGCPTGLASPGSAVGISPPGGGSPGAPGAHGPRGA